MTRRLLASSLTLTFFVLIVLVVPLGLTFSDHERDQLRSSIERDAVVIASYVEDGLQDGDPLEEGLVAKYASESGARVVVVEASGIAVIDTDSIRPGRSFATRPEMQAALDGRVAWGTRHSDTLDADVLYMAVPVASGGRVHGAVRLTYPTSTVDRRVTRFWWRLAAVAAISLGAAAAIGWVLAQTVSRPLRRLAAAATAIGRGELSRRVEADSGPPVVRALGAAFDDMAARLEALVHAQDAFVADASHQLRNPLTALRLRLENVQADAGPDVADDLGGALDEVARLSRLTDGLLALARAEHEGAPLTGRAVDVVPIVEERRQAWLPLAEERAIRLERDLPAAATAVATPDRLRQVIDNLVANAIDATPEASRVLLRVVTADGVVEVHVIDEGRGMERADRIRAFDRFWSGDGSAPAVVGSSGLGLSIVRKLVLSDGGDVELGEAPGGGIDAVVRLRARATMSAS